MEAVARKRKGRNDSHVGLCWAAMVQAIYSMLGGGVLGVIAPLNLRYEDFALISKIPRPTPWLNANGDFKSIRYGPLNPLWQRSPIDLIGLASQLLML